jgi:hypothetical protein
MVGRRPEDSGSVLDGMLVVRVNVLNPHHHSVPDIASLARSQFR